MAFDIGKYYGAIIDAFAKVMPLLHDSYSGLHFQVFQHLLRDLAAPFRIDGPPIYESVGVVPLAEPLPLVLDPLAPAAGCASIVASVREVDDAPGNVELLAHLFSTRVLCINSFLVVNSYRIETIRAIGAYKEADL